MKSLRICFVGDSFVNGTGDPEFLGWAGRVCAVIHTQGHDITCYNLGIRRDTSADILSRWHREASCRLPQGIDGRVVFSFGVNDTTIENGRPRVESSESIRNALQILTQARQSYPTLMVGPPPTADAEKNTQVSHLSRELGLACGKLGVPYLDVFTPLEESGIWMREAEENDGAHPRAGGYAELASLVQGWPAWQSWFD